MGMWDYIVETLEREKRLNSFLNAIGQLESSGGKNTNHATVKRGLNAGDAAVGTYGMMPLTMADVVRLHQSRFPALRKMTPDQVANAAKTNSEIARKLAEAHAEYLLDKYGDPEAAAFAWRIGTYSKRAKKPEIYRKHPYVQAFRKKKAEGET